MRVSCEACGAHYNLPDEKVRGRRAKVQCKRCQATIVVDGTSLVPAANDFEEDDETTQVMDANKIGQLAAATTAQHRESSQAPSKADLPPRDPERWTVNLSETEQYEMTTEQVVEGWLGGLVSDDAYVWKEGLDDWTPIADVAELVDLINAAIDEQDSRGAEKSPAPEVEPEPPTIAIAARVPAAVPGPSKVSIPQPTPLGNTVGSIGLSSSARAPQAKSPPTPAAPTFFPSIEETKPLALAGGSSGQKAAPRPPQAPRAPQTSAPEQPRRGPPPRDQIGERHENSVLFSLDALKRDSGNANRAGRYEDDLLTAAPTATANDFSFMPLIQVEAPVAPEAPAPAGAQRPQPQPKASIAPVVTAAAPAPVLYSETPPPRGGALKMFAAIVLGGAVLGGGYLAAQRYGLLNPVAQTNATPALEAQTPPTAAPTPSAEAEAVVAPSASTEAAPSASASAAPGAPVVQDQVTGARVDTQAPQPGRSETKPATDAPKTPQEDTGETGDTTKPGDPAKPGGEPEVTAPDTPEEKPEEKPAEASDAPPFNAEAAKEALRQAAANVGSCAAPDGPSGSGQVQVTFLPSGRVSSANVVSGPFGGTTVGGCVARTFRQGRVPAFSGAPVTVSKSFQIGN